MNRKKDKTQLTEVELELMSIFWELEEGSVTDVLHEVIKHRKMAYTSASTIVRILENKKFLKSKKVGNARIYTPLVTRAEYESRSLTKMVKKLFNNKPLAMVARLMQEEDLSEEDLRAMKNLLEKKLSND